MNKFIVTTTIQPPTKATLKFAEIPDWTLVIVGDLKTPHDDYYKIQSSKVIYLSPYFQEDMYPNISNLIGWNTIQRRNIGFIYAYTHGADIVASVDDDNIPYDNWGKDVRVGQIVNVDVFDTVDGNVFDPMQLTNHKELWHRGFPLSEIKNSKNKLYYGIQPRKVLFQADFWNGDPDVDAICRMIHQPDDLEIKIPMSFTSNNYMSFNSQNTFIAREALPYYMCLPYVGRVDDIWGGYIAQYLLNTRPIFMPATVYQERNEQSIEKNLKDEIFGHINTKRFLDDIEHFEHYLPKETNMAFWKYRRVFNEDKENV